MDDEGILKAKFQALWLENERLREREELVTKHYVNMTKHASNLESEIIALEAKIAEALDLMEKCKFDKTDKYIAISEYKEYQELKAILERRDDSYEQRITRID